MNAVLALFRSTLGRKVVMAVTGLILFGFVIGHMVGNLQVYLGPEALNAYGAVRCGSCCTARGSGSPAAVLLVAVVLHIWAARLADAARTAPRARRAIATRSLERVDLRLAHDALERRDPAALHRLPPAPLHRSGSVASRLRRGRRLPQLRRGFQRAAGRALLHRRDAGSWACTCYHGVWSMLQTLGPQPPALQPPAPRLRDARSPRSVVLGNISFPLAVLAGLVEVERGATRMKLDVQHPRRARSRRSGTSTASR